MDVSQKSPCLLFYCEKNIHIAIQRTVTTLDGSDRGILDFVYVVSGSNIKYGMDLRILSEIRFIYY